MVEFNPDGSLKLPAFLAKKRAEDEDKMKRQHCIKISREMISFKSPKKCVLKITLSDALNDNKFIENLYYYFQENASVPTKMKKIDEKRFEVEIGTDFKRCSDCNSLIKRYREHLDGNIIDEKGSCTYEGRQSNFSYEDYFD